MSENALEIEGLTRRVEGFLLDRVGFTVPTGAVMGFLGGNGAGKSTTLKSVLGLVRPDAGRIAVFGNPPGERARRLIGHVSEEPPFYPERSVRWHGELAAGVFEGWDAARFAELCAAFELPLDRNSKDLSRGMKVKLGLALALSHQARLLVLDEPTSGIDPVGRRQILGLLRAFQAQGDRAILFSSHLTQDVHDLATHVTVLHRGRVLTSQALPEFLARRPGATVEQIYLDLVDAFEAAR